MSKTLRMILTAVLINPLVVIASDEVKEVDLSLLKERGMLMRVLTDGRPVWIAYRTTAAIENIKKRSHIHYPNDPVGIDKGFRSYNKNYFVVFGGCPRADELPAYYPDEGFVCRSNCAAFDMAGRPTNDCTEGKSMDIPKYYFKDEKTIIVPIHQDGNT